MGVALWNRPVARHEVIPPSLDRKEESDVREGEFDCLSHRRSCDEISTTNWKTLLQNSVRPQVFFGDRVELRRVQETRTGGRFFQAEDGIRYVTVTGVQTCALPIWRLHVDRAASPQTAVRDLAAERIVRPAGLPRRDDVDVTVQEQRRQGRVPPGLP